MNTRAFTSVPFWAAIGLIAGFFLPWISVVGIISIPGYQVSDMMRQDAIGTIKEQKERAASVHYQLYASSEEREQSAAKVKNAQVSITTSFALYLIPALAALCVILELRSARFLLKRVGCFLAGLVTIALLFFLYWQRNKDGSALQQASIGVWITCASGIVALLGSLVSQRRPLSTSAIAAEASTVAGGNDVK